ncbi:PEP-CTERM sorting domain-containing protein [Paludisphaera soli]|uniref:PEP-CTERM sorting domain-containing protein n=1 Tax=Paludisphaera soli TaxID=2712865 RepID=UPI0013ECAB23|nr:PEP-CTERM sorting domain-containing protein [Paludisphaera soli]
MHRTFLGLAALLALASTAARADFTVDDFGTSPQSTSITGGTGSTSSTTAAVGVLGGSRTLNLAVSANPFGQNATAVVTGGDPGYFILNSGAGVNASGSIVYDAFGAGLGGEDLAQYGSQFEVDLIAADARLTLGITLTDTFGATRTVSFSNLSVGLVSFGFAGFTGVDLTSLASVALVFDAPESADFVLNFIGVTGNVPPVVPEPASAGLMGLGLILAVVSARRRRRARA